ncbi:hypothetical protein ScPMuIL_018666 [Solemya velum]
MGVCSVDRDSELSDYGMQAMRDWNSHRGDCTPKGEKNHNTREVGEKSGGELKSGAAHTSPAVGNSGSGVCHVCGTTSELRTCKGCHHVSYCSKDCQKKDWRNHRQQCQFEGGKHLDTSEFEENNGSENKTDAAHTTLAVGKSGGSVCHVCGITSGLRACTGCHRVSYCSKDCQGKDWRKHRQICHPIEKDAGGARIESSMDCSAKKNSMPDEKQCGDICHVCGRRSKLKDCSRCHRISYCSKNCQTRDWQNHRESCKSSGEPFPKRTDVQDGQKNTENGADATSADSSSPLRLTVTGGRTCTMNACMVCGAPQRMICSKCNIARYCSDRCQQQNWETHKAFCSQLVQSESIPNSQPGEFGGFSSFASKGGPQFSQSFEEFIKFPVPEVDPMVRFERKVPFAVAQAECVRMFPSMKVIDSIDRLRSEVFGVRPPKRPEVLIAFMPRWHGHAMRHGVYIEDKYGKETFINFYLQGDGRPEPYFTWKALQPGKYISVAYPFMHFFRDGNIGLRVEDPSDIKILEF